MSASERLGGSKLKVFLAGRVALEADGTLVGEERFPGRQGRLLFAYLVAEQGRPVPRDELAEALWGEELPTTWDKALTVLVSKLRGLLADHGIDGAQALTSAFGCYRLVLPEESWVDVVAASSAVQEAEGARRSRPRWRHRWCGSPSCRGRMGRGSRRSVANSATSALVRWSLFAMHAFVQVMHVRR
jgi:hypothetical protein